MPLISNAVISPSYIIHPAPEARRLAPATLAQLSQNLRRLPPSPGGDFVDALAKTEGKSFAAFEKEFFEKVRPTSLIKRFAAPEEVASLVAYVASPLASATTGAALRVDGGVVKSAF